MTAKDEDSPRSIDITPEQAYALMVAALDVVGSVSRAVHTRIARDVDAGRGGASPSVRARDLVALRRTLDVIRPGITDKVIGLPKENLS